MAIGPGSFGDSRLNIRLIVFWSLIALIPVPFCFLAAHEVPAYLRRSELQRRVFRGRGQWLMSPFQRPVTYFHSRKRVPQSVVNVVSENWLRPLEPFTRAILVPKSDDDVRNLSPEVELEQVTIVVEDGTCTEQLIHHLLALPKLRSLSLCNIPITDRGIDLLLQMPQLKELHIECAAEPSPGLRRLAELVFLENFFLMDLRLPISDDVYEQVASMQNLRELRLLGSELTADRCRVIAGSRSLENFCCSSMDCNLTLELAQRLAAMPKIRCIEFYYPGNQRMEPEAEEFLKQRDLLPEEEVLLGLPRL
ncbi:MAG: hypothetical protein JWP89_2963 [Schlesneria sp.]|nr:hypothetical protein [Schlesneria sp.]